MAVCLDSSIEEPYPHAVHAQHIENGLVKFPTNVHGIYVDHNERSPYTTVTIRQNDARLSFLLLPEDCEHLAKLLLKTG